MTEIGDGIDSRAGRLVDDIEVSQIYLRLRRFCHLLCSPFAPVRVTLGCSLFDGCDMSDRIARTTCRAGGDSVVELMTI